MISREEAQERLKYFYNPDHVEEQLEHLKKLPPALERLGQILIMAGSTWTKLQSDIRLGRKIEIMNSDFLEL